MEQREKDRMLRWMQRTLDRYESPLIRYAGNILQGDTERARDVVQETFLRLWRAGRAGSDDGLAEWLFTVCRNRAIDVRRKEKRMNRLDDNARRGESGDHRSPHAAAEHNEDVGRMLAAMKLLPDNQQEVLLLKFQNGFSYKEISNITGHSVSYVGVLIHTAVKALRNRMTAARPSHRGEQS